MEWHAKTLETGNPERFHASEISTTRTNRCSASAIPIMSLQWIPKIWTALSPSKPQASVVKLHWKSFAPLGKSTSYTERQISHLRGVTRSVTSQSRGWKFALTLFICHKHEWCNHEIKTNDKQSGSKANVNICVWSLLQARSELSRTAKAKRRNWIAESLPLQYRLDHRLGATARGIFCLLRSERLNEASNVCFRQLFSSQFSF